MKLIKSSPVYVSETKKGLKKFWQGQIVYGDAGYHLQSESWQDLKDGGQSKHNVSVPYLVTPKNIGKANETTPLEQAELELASMVKKQIDSKDYSEVGSKKKETKKLPLPMLAHKYRDHAKKIKYPAYCQRKLDGNRMIFNGKYAQSRGGQQILPEVVEHLKFDVGNYILDGELILPENPPLQTTMSAIKKFNPETSPTLIYHVYDLVDESLPYSERLRLLRAVFKQHDIPDNVHFVETYPIHDEGEMKQYHEQFVLEGFEGTIIRNADGKYDVNHRSYDLQKHKDFDDKEFEIVGVGEGEGLYKGCAIFTCITEDGKEFESNPKGTLEYKKALYDDRENLIGKWLTVRFFGYTLEGKPNINIGVEIRDYGEF